MASRAVWWLSIVTPAQQLLSTVTCASGKAAFTIMDRKLFALLGMHIVCTVGIPGIDDRSIKGGNLLYHIGDDGCSMSTA